MCVRQMLLRFSANNGRAAVHYEYVFIIWLYVLLDVTYGYKRNKHCKKVFVSFIYILLLELIPLGAIYLIINNVLPDYVMRKNLIFL